MKKNIKTVIVNKSYKFRIWLDNVIYYFVSRYNHWELLDQFKEKDVLVVGNGPSINKTELSKIDIISIGMNKINLLFHRTTWRPSIITCVNSIVLWQNRKFYNKTDIILVLPPRALYLGIKKRKNVIITKIYNSVAFRNDIDNGIAFCGSTVTYTALQIAAYLLPKSINIVGVDHYFKNYTGRSAIVKYKGEDSDHFDPKYFQNSIWGLPDLDGSELAYSLAKTYFDDNKIPIVDYTIGGKCKVFIKGEISKLYTK